MTQRLFWSISLAAIALPLLGCAQSTAPTVTIPTLSSTVDTTIGTDPTGLRTGIAGAFQVDVDIAQQKYEITPVDYRGTQAIGDLFFLPVNGFNVVALLPPTCGPWFNTTNLPGSWDLFYNVEHAFDAPANPGGTATAGNRADLGITGRIVWMVDAPTTTTDPLDSNYEGNFTFPFASETVICNPTTVLNANGFFRPNGMLTGFYSPLNGTTYYPFTALMDENLDSRTVKNDCNTAITHGPDSLGNYASTQSWGAMAAWAGLPGGTGYGVLHQGQQATGYLRLPGNLGGLNTTALIVASYIDPRGGANAAEKRANRLPKDDVTLFAYKMPHGAVDLERVIFDNFSGPLTGIQGATVTADLRVVDQDFSTAIGTGLNEIPNPSGIGSMEMAAMELGLQNPTLPPALGTGQMETPVLYTGLQIAYTDVPPAIPGGIDTAAYVGVRLVDEQSIATAGLEQGVSLGADLAPMTANMPQPIVVQVALCDIN